jgi:hypothetical protein
MLLLRFKYGVDRPPQFRRPLRIDASVETYMVVMRMCLVDTGLLNSPGINIISSYGPIDMKSQFNSNAIGTGKSIHTDVRL